jgi:glycosyltransferase involved in cell wall biosynthesis
MPASTDRPEPLRVGILIASLKVGGAERAALGLLEGLQGAGVEAHLLTLDSDREMLQTLSDDRREAVLSHLVGLGGGEISRSTVAKLAAGPRQWLALRRTVRRLDLDVLVSVMERANIMSLLTLAPLRRVLSIRSYPSKLIESKTRLKRWLVVRFYRLLLRRADRVVFVSREAAADFETLFPAVAGRGTVIYNACNVDRMRALGDSPIPEPHVGLFADPVVVACGRMNPEKGHWSLVRSFSRVSQRVPDARLVILGSGVLEDELKLLVDRLGLTDRVLFPGFEPNPAAWISRARVYVLPSVWEGFPNSLLEALAIGIPVVASDCRSGPRELLLPGTDPTRKTDKIEETPCGYLVPAPDGRRLPASDPPTRQELMMAEAIERALGNAESSSRQAEAARQRADEFAPEKIFPNWIEVLRPRG